MYVAKDVTFPRQFSQIHQGSFPLGEKAEMIILFSLWYLSSVFFASVADFVHVI